MLYTQRECLTRVLLEVGENNVSIDALKTVLMKYPSNVIYCEVQGKLIGIISTGDICRVLKRGGDKVDINRNYMYLSDEDSMKARVIFKDYPKINALPVVTEDGSLIGDYTRWDDLMELEYNLGADGIARGINWDGTQNIVIVKPGNICSEKQNAFEKFEHYLTEQNVVFICVNYLEVSRYLDTADLILFADENEMRAFGVILGIESGEECSKYFKLKKYIDFVQKQKNFSDLQFELYLKELSQKGVKIFHTTFKDDEFNNMLLKKIDDKFKKKGNLPTTQLSNPIYKDLFDDLRLPKCMYEQFFDDLYSEEYTEKILNIPFAYENKYGVFGLKDCQSQYYNVLEGERFTVNQPEKYEKTIYFVGPCYIYGLYVEDKNTIESFLQKHLNQSNYKVKVVNYGSVGEKRVDCIYMPRIAMLPLRRGDIIVVGSLPVNIDFINSIILNYVLEQNDVKVEWLINNASHCNHKVNKLYADAIYNALKPILSEQDELQGELIKKDENFVKILYLDYYFKDFDFSKYDKIGAVVMNCNPYTNGHRYLVDQALKVVDFLIVFVVTEDMSIFSSTERFAMVQANTADLKNVKVVPSGPFIATKMSIPEYFKKETSEEIVEHMEQDIETFAKAIALQLGIRYRFFGEEPMDEVTYQYNLAMKKVLPQYGIKAIEVPRKKINGNIVSASTVRKYLKEKNIDKMSELVPETTIDVLRLKRTQ